MRILFTLTVFLSSALLFLIEPMVAKIILPAFGGSPAVWTTCMVFYQALLLAGYAYAHASTSKLGPRRQALVHVPLMFLALLTLPFTTHVVGGATGSGAPLWKVLATLLVMVGAVFFVVSAGAPLLQRWFAATGDPHAHDPYFLYSASNLGSMLALIAYPLIVEPQLRLSEQTRMWSGGYVALALLMAVTAAMLHFKAKDGADTAAEAKHGPIENRQRLMWVVLGAVPSSLLLGVTAYLTENVAPIPLLWVIPLALYLLTFIIAFARKRAVTSAPLARLLPLLVTPLVLAVILESSTPLVPLALFHLATFFVAALMCHTRLSETRPEPSRLTEFFLWMSVGGVVGGLFNAVVAPTAFSTLLEYPIALVAACYLRPAKKPELGTFIRSDALYLVAVLFISIAMTLTVELTSWFPPSPKRTLIAIGLPALLCFFAVDRPKRYSSCLAAVFMVAFMFHVSAIGHVIFTGRSFFGVHRVIAYGQGGRFHELVHGVTKHGIQDLNRPGEPLTYYTRTGPIGHVFNVFHGARAKANVAFVGLGVGSVAAYGEPGQHMTFFEIDPIVRAIATNPKYFTFLRDSKADVDVILGDARLTLAQQPDSRFGLIVLDAFSSDAIPMHLLTEEAIRMYVQKLEPHGVLALHISNRYLDLAPVLAATADDMKLAAMIDNDDDVTDAEMNAGKTPSDWVVMARDKSDFQGLNKETEWDTLPTNRSIRPWTDDFSNILESFKSSGSKIQVE